MDTLGWFTLLAVFISTVNGAINIVDLRVPSTLENGSSDEVILDCDYEVNDEKGLEVKWFFGDDEEQVYQWIPQTSKPQALGMLKDRIDLEYKVSDDPNTMHRALRIKNITLDLTGYYKCKVTSFFNEDTEKKFMTIYEPAKDFDLEHDPEENMVNCTASGIFPKPKMNIYILNTNSTDVKGDDEDDDEIGDAEKDEDHDGIADDLRINEEIDGDFNNNGIDDALERPDASSEDDDYIEENDDSTFNVTSIFTYEDEELKPITVFVCELWIPQTSYKLKKTMVYHQGGAQSTVETQIESDYDSDEFPTDTTEQDGTDSSSSLQASSMLTFAVTTWILAQMV